MLRPLNLTSCYLFSESKGFNIFALKSWKAFTYGIKRKFYFFIGQFIFWAAEENLFHQWYFWIHFFWCKMSHIEFIVVLLSLLVLLAVIPRREVKRTITCRSGCCSCQSGTRRCRRWDSPSVAEIALHLLTYGVLLPATTWIAKNTPAPLLKL